MNRLFRVAATAAAGFCTTAADAQDYAAAMRAFVSQNVMPWSGDATMLAAIIAQNQAHAGLAQADIDALDLAWRAEVGAAVTPTIAPVLNNELSKFLRARLADAGGAITEIFVMDDRGLLVATSGVTSDYWQGDEEKRTETYLKGPGALHAGEIEFDESSQSYQGQVSFPIVDPASGAAVGAITIGLDAEAM